MRRQWLAARAGVPSCSSCCPTAVSDPRTVATCPQRYRIGTTLTASILHERGDQWRAQHDTSQHRRTSTIWRPRHQPNSVRGGRAYERACGRVPGRMQAILGAFVAYVRQRTRCRRRPARPSDRRAQGGSARTAHRTQEDVNLQTSVLGTTVTVRGESRRTERATMMKNSDNTTVEAMCEVLPIESESLRSDGHFPVT